MRCARSISIEDLLLTNNVEIVAKKISKRLEKPCSQPETQQGDLGFQNPIYKWNMENVYFTSKFLRIFFVKITDKKELNLTDSKNGVRTEDHQKVALEIDRYFYLLSSFQWEDLEFCEELTDVFSFLCM